MLGGVLPSLPGGHEGRQGRGGVLDRQLSFSGEKGEVFDAFGLHERGESSKRGTSRE